MHNPEQGTSLPETYETIEPTILRSTREAIQERGVSSLTVDDLSERDVDHIPWSGGALHVKHVAQEIVRAKIGESDYLAVRSPEGYPVSIGCVDYAKKPDGGYLSQLSTHEQLRGLGIGTRLIQEAERRIVSRGQEWAYLCVETNNPKAKALYERLGYEVYEMGVDSWNQLDQEGNEVLYTTDVFEMKKRVRG